MQEFIQTRIRNAEGTIDSIEQQLQTLTSHSVGNVQKLRTKLQCKMRQEYPSPLKVSPVAGKLACNLSTPPTYFHNASPIFSLKSQSKKPKLAECSDASTILEEENLSEVDSNWDFLSVKKPSTSWMRDVDNQWIQAQLKYEPEDVFDPPYTPRQTGYRCELHAIFPHSKRNYSQRGDSSQWH